MKDPHQAWYLVLTKPRHEKMAEMHLLQQGFRVYLPLLTQHKKIKNTYEIFTEALFPRYLFVHLRAGVDDSSRIRSTRGCVSLVMFGPVRARVPNALVQLLKGEEDQRIKFIDTERELQAGDRVKILAGILEGYEGIIATKNGRDRVTLLLSLADGYTRNINLSLHELKKVG